MDDNTYLERSSSRLSHESCKNTRMRLKHLPISYNCDFSLIVTSNAGYVNMRVLRISESWIISTFNLLFKGTRKILKIIE